MQRIISGSLLREPKFPASDERFFPIIADIERLAIFLSQAQYEFIRNHFKKKEGPIEALEWWKPHDP